MLRIRKFDDVTLVVFYQFAEPFLLLKLKHVVMDSHFAHQSLDIHLLIELIFTFFDYFLSSFYVEAQGGFGAVYPIKGGQHKI